MLQLAERGDHRNVDILVKDIYGGDYSSQGLPGDLIASSFGKAMSCGKHKFAQVASEIYYQRSLALILSLPVLSFSLSFFLNVCDDILGPPKFSEADLARSLLFTISNDIGQIASLYATVYSMDKVYFGGYFLRNHPLSMHTISYSIKYWSHVSLCACFFCVLCNISSTDILFARDIVQN